MRAASYAAGLSPRVRGKPQSGLPVRHGCGSIPAGAGETRTAAIYVPSVRVYPRGCGGNGHAPQRLRDLRGLSPRVRGKQTLRGMGFSCKESIPAGAEETDGPRPLWRRAGVYPRGCGGNCACPRPVNSNWGLSPRVRGKLGAALVPICPPGSIPAGAGETTAPGITMPAGGVYPRGCGGNVRRWQSAWAKAGLSPRVRGKRIDPARPQVWAGSIPAGAGETVPVRFLAHWVRVYPRGCGGNRRSGRLPRWSVGLSPRVRGKQILWR